MAKQCYYCDKVLSIQGYDIIRKDRINRNGGDIIIYVRNDLQYETIQLPHLNYEIMPIVFPSIKTILIALYHHYWGNSKHHSTTIDILYNIINSHDSRKTNHITIVGDFNDFVHHIHDTTMLYKFQSNYTYLLTSRQLLTALTIMSCYVKINK